MIPVLPYTVENLKLAAENLKRGLLVAFPTETVYGLGANALDAAALSRIFEVKRRPFFDPLIVHIADVSWLDRLCAHSDPRAETLVRRFWPGPLTLVLPKTTLVPDLATSGLPAVAVRMPAHPAALGLIRAAGFPLAAPSANPFGRLSPTTARHVEEHFDEGISMILDGGPCAVGVESTVLSLEGDVPVLLRAGGITLEELQTAVGHIAVTGAVNSGQPSAPGQLSSHYAPRTPMRLLEGRVSTEEIPPRCGLLAFAGAPEDPLRPGYAAVEILSPTGRLGEAAARLFACLHRLDGMGLGLIHAELPPSEGLGLAILDRLRKAAAG